MKQFFAILSVSLIMAMVGCTLVICSYLDKIEVAYAENPISREWHKSCNFEMALEQCDVVVSECINEFQADSIIEY